MTWALVPAIPNADVAATRCPLTAGHGVRVVASRKPCFSQSISGLASAACKVGGIAQCSAATRILARPNAPLAAGVAQVRFHRSQQGAAPGFGVAVCLRQRTQLGAVPEPGAGAVPFDHADLVGTDARLGDGAAEQTDLGRAVRGAQAGAAPVVVGGGAANFGKDVSPVAQCRRLSLQHKDGRPSAQTVPLACAL